MDYVHECKLEWFLIGRPVDVPTGCTDAHIPLGCVVGHSQYIKREGRLSVLEAQRKLEHRPEPLGALHVIIGL
tara:strand:- start:1 stop:219 length:219 start_codon:yes stop_codon:yes gene_type:complete